MVIGCLKKTPEISNTSTKLTTHIPD